MPAFIGSLQWDTSTLDTDGILSVRLPGDYSHNGIANIADYALSPRNLESAASLPNDDTTGIEQDDFTRWRAHFGQTAGSGAGRNANAAVPEPATLVMLIVAAASVSPRRRWYVSRFQNSSTRDTAENPRFVEKVLKVVAR